MALANVAWILASNGKRVLAVDWDLEAPGLHRYFAPFLADSDLTSTDGIIEFVRNFEAAALTPAVEGEAVEATQWYRPLADLSKFAVALEWDFGPLGYLHFVPAGRQGPAYTRNVNSFNWDNFYDRLGGAAFLEAAKEHLKAHYDYVLIDSRTGVSDTAGVCTVQMPDALVVFFTANNQSIEGTASLASAVERFRRTIPGGSDIRIFPVLTRIEKNERDKLERRQQCAREVFRPFLEQHISDEKDQRTYWGRVETPYDPYYSYEEVLATFRDDPSQETSLLSRMERLTGYLTDGEVTRLEPPDPARREAVLRKFFRSPSRDPVASPARPAWDGAQAGAKTEAGRHLVLTVRGLARGARSGGSGPPWDSDLEAMVLGRNPDVQFCHLRFGFWDFLAFFLPYVPRLRNFQTEAPVSQGARRLQGRPSRRRRPRYGHILRRLGHSHNLPGGRSATAAALPYRDPGRQRAPHGLSLGRAPWPGCGGTGDQRLRDPGQHRSLVHSPPRPDRCLGAVRIQQLTDSRFQNRYHKLGHDGFFDDAANGGNFMRDKWLPLLTTNEPAAPVDERDPSSRVSNSAGLLFRIAEFLRFFVFLLALLLIFVFVSMYYSRATRQASAPRRRRTGSTRSTGSRPCPTPEFQPGRRLRASVN